jgi:hypothetical protein
MKSLPSFFALAATASIGLPSSAAQVWVAPAAQKIRPSIQPVAGAPTSAAISSAQNEFESFQVVVTGPASGISMGVEGLSDGQGHTITGRDVVLYREALLDVPSPSGGDGAAGMWPDALVPDVDPIAAEKRNAFPFDVPAGESRAVFVDIHAPDGTPAGVYAGVIHVTGDITQDVPVRLTVWDFSIPSTATLRSAFGMSWNGPCVGHGDPGCSGGASDLALRARYVQAALDDRVSIHTPYYTATVDSSGNENWANFDQYAGQFLDGTAPTRLKGARLTSLAVNGPFASDAAQVAKWSAHAKARGWTSTTLFDYVCDEPPLTCAWSAIPDLISQSRSGDASVPTLVTTTTDEAIAQGVSGIDLFVPVINYMEGKPGAAFAGNQRAKYGNDVWWYQSCMSFGCSSVGGGRDGSGETGWPTYAVDSDATRNRAMEWMSFSYAVSGELYYETTLAYFNGDPWVTQSAFGGTGDGTLFYPGTPAKIGGSTEIPVESLRLKHLRDGMEDYELLYLASTLGLGAQALAIAQGIYPRTYQATTSPAALDSARAGLAALILHALGKDGPPPPPPPAPAGSDGTPTPPPTGCTTTACTTPDPTSKGASASAPGFPSGGCSSNGVQSAWLAIPALLLFAVRRRKTRLVHA